MEKSVTIENSFYLITTSVYLGGFDKYPNGFTQWFITVGDESKKPLSPRLVNITNSLLTKKNKKEYQDFIGEKRNPVKEILTLWSNIKKIAPKVKKMRNPSTFQKYSECKKFVEELVQLAYQEWQIINKDTLNLKI